MEDTELRKRTVSTKCFGQKSGKNLTKKKSLFFVDILAK